MPNDSVVNTSAAVSAPTPQVIDAASRQHEQNLAESDASPSSQAAHNIAVAGDWCSIAGCLCVGPALIISSTAFPATWTPGAVICGLSIVSFLVRGLSEDTERRPGRMYSSSDFQGP